MCTVTHFLLVTAKHVMRLPFTKRCTVTHLLLLIAKWWDCLPQNCAMSLTSYWSEQKMWWDCLAPKCERSLTFCWSYVGKDVMRLLFTKPAILLWFTHTLWNKGMCPNCLAVEWPALLTSFYNWISKMSWEQRKQCHWLSFATLLYLINSHKNITYILFVLQ